MYTVDKTIAQKLQCTYAFMLHDISKLDWSTERDKILKMTKVPLEHSFDNHVFCLDKWCQTLQAKARGRDYFPTIPYLSKSVNLDMYDQFKSVFDKFTTPEVIPESVHILNTQKNKSFNNVAACLSPKKKYLAKYIPFCPDSLLPHHTSMMVLPSFTTKSLTGLVLMISIPLLGISPKNS